MIPVTSNQVYNRSSNYYDQAEFITDFLLNNNGNITTYPSDFTMPPSNNIQEHNETLASKHKLDDYTNQDNVDTTSSRDNNTETNELQVIPMNSVPVVFSSVIDTLPVHPRIPRRSLAKTRTRFPLNRHSTRVNPDLPVRFLLPPPIAKHKCSGDSVTDQSDPPFKIKPIVISSATPLIPISAVATPNEHVVTAKPLQVKSEQKESSPIKLSPNRGVFVPPPPRHLIPPPFTQENHVKHQYTTPQNSLPERNSIRPFSPQNNVYESSTKPHDCDKTNRIESSSVKPIIVVEDIREINRWSSQSSSLPPPLHSTTYKEPIRNVELINNNEPIRYVESFNKFSLAENFNQLGASTTSENPPVYGELNIPHPVHKNDYETQLCDKNHYVAANQSQHSENYSPNNPQEFNHNNQPLSANNQIFVPNRQDSFQNSKKQFIPNIPQKYIQNNQQPFPNDQVQSTPSNRIFPNDQHHFNQDYQHLLSVDNHQKLSTNDPQEFKPNNAQSLNNHDLTENKPPCNESNQQQLTLDKQYSQQRFPTDNQHKPQQFPLDKQSNQQQFNPNQQYKQQRLSLDKQYNNQHFPLVNQHKQQQFPTDKQYSQQDLRPKNQYNHQQVLSDNQYNQQQLSPNNQYDQQHPSEKKCDQEQFPSHKHHNQQQLNPNHQYNEQQFPSEKQYNQQQLNPNNQQQYVSSNQFHEQAVNLNDNFSPSDHIQFSQTSATQTSVTRKPASFTAFKSSPYEHYALKPTTPLPLASSIEPFPILRGPNIEQALFDTGHFQVDDISFNDTVDSTVAMMNRPLLTQEVAQTGMKITANMKMGQINKAKLSRGRYKFNHLNQFNFPDLDEPSKSNEVSKSSKLLVAETSYYKDRRGVKELTETAGKENKCYSLHFFTTFTI